MYNLSALLYDGTTNLRRNMDGLIIFAILFIASTVKFITELK